MMHGQKTIKPLNFFNVFTTVCSKIPFFRDMTLRRWVTGPRRYGERSVLTIKRLGPSKSREPIST
jgi:hypothetical protein